MSKHINVKSQASWQSCHVKYQMKNAKSVDLLRSTLQRSTLQRATLQRATLQRATLQSIRESCCCNSTAIAISTLTSGLCQSQSLWISKPLTYQVRCYCALSLSCTISFQPAEHICVWLCILGTLDILCKWSFLLYYSVFLKIGFSSANLFSLFYPLIHLFIETFWYLSLAIAYLLSRPA